MVRPEAEVHLQELIIDAVEEVSAAAARKNIVCNIEIDDLPSVRCDPDMVRRALLNLLRNSIDFSPEGGTVVVTLARADDRAVIEVADRGCGIAAADLPKVFDRFYRSDEARSDGGTGLGLAVVKSVVEAHHGEVGIESTPGAGTTVRMLLPIQGA